LHITSFAMDTAIHLRKSTSKLSINLLYVLYSDQRVIACQGNNAAYKTHAPCEHTVKVYVLAIKRMVHIFSTIVKVFKLTSTLHLYS